MITNQEIFEQFYKDCNELPIDEIIKNYGGGTIYVPSYKSTLRDKHIYQKYKEGYSIHQLKREFNLSANRIRNIIKEQERQQKQKTLF